jgi:hypothetical protein
MERIAYKIEYWKNILVIKTLNCSFMIRLITVIILSISFSFCSSDKSNLKQEKEATGSNTKTPEPSTEIFRGTSNNVNIIFAHTNYTHYRITEGGKITEGNLNTERGFENDDDATVYILDYDKPENQQKFFVRMTDGRIMMLDSNRKIIPGSSFVRQ